MKMLRGESPSEMSIQVLTQFAMVLALKGDNRRVCRREVVKFAVRGEAVSVQGGASAGMEEPLSSSADKHLVFAIC
jgi:hypothetical protein